MNANYLVATSIAQETENCKRVTHLLRGVWFLESAVGRKNHIPGIFIPLGASQTRKSVVQWHNKRKRRDKDHEKKNHFPAGADDRKVAVVCCTVGNLGRTFWKDIMIMTSAVGFALVFFRLNSRNYNAMLGSEDTAKGPGVEKRLITISSMAVSAFAAAVIVSSVGIINSALLLKWRKK